MEEQAVAAAAAVVVGGVRVVARICPPAADPAAPTTTTAAAAAAAASSFQVAATRGGSHPRSPDAAALLSFTGATTPSSSSSSQGQRKEEHKIDWCYLQHETNHHIFLNEVKPLVQHLLGGGTTSCSNACVVTCGAATSTDRLFIGSQDEPGLVTMSMEQILEFSKTIAGAVRVSSYQVLQDTHVFDLLEPKDQEVLILEGSDGRTHLKGLSKVHVKSIEDFTQLSCFDTSQNKQPTKATTPLHARGHQGLIIHISSFDQEGIECAVAKMNFLNLTGYVDPKQKNDGGAAALSNSNKSMYALMNVAQALNNNQSFIPYRQSKVTRILQDSLGKSSGAVLITCLDEISCQDTVSTLSLAARSSKVANEQFRRSMSVPSSKRPNVNLSANVKSSSRPFLPSIHKPNPAVEKHDRPQWNNSAVKARRTPIANKRSQPIMHSVNKSGSLFSTPIKMKQKDAKPSMNGRSQPISHLAKKSERLLSTMKIKQKDTKPTTSGSSLLCPSTNLSKEDEIVVAPTAIKAVEEVQSSRDMEIHAPSTYEGFDKSNETLDIVSSGIKKVVSSTMEDYSSSDLHAVSSCTDFGETYSSNVPDKLVEETPVNANKHSPKISDRLREISNSLKLLSARPLRITTQKVCTEMTQNVGTDDTQRVIMEDVQLVNTDVPEPKTPVMHLKYEDVPEPKTPVMHLKYEEVENRSNSFKARSTGIKKSLVQENIDVPEPRTPVMHLKYEEAENPSNSFKAPSTGIKRSLGQENVDVPEPRSPVMHLKYEQGENPSTSFKTRSAGIKKALVRECLTFLNSASKEELKSLKGIGEQRANSIIELRENSPELFKEMDDLRDIIGMNQTEIKKMMSAIIES
ncbi:unnamed protein product [Alopecurus aequalis]